MAIAKQCKEYTDISPERKTGYTYQGKEIIAGRMRGRPPTWARNPKFYTPEVRQDAATLYAVYGNTEEVANLCNVPEKILKEWRQEPWWIEIQKQVYAEQNDRLASRISRVLDVTITQLEDRLEHGDHCIVQKTGEVIVKPVDASVLAKMFEGLAHQRRIVRGEPTSITAKVGLDDRLKQLETAFIRFAGAKEITHDETEITTISTRTEASEGSDSEGIQEKCEETSSGYDESTDYEECGESLLEDGVEDALIS